MVYTLLHYTLHLCKSTRQRSYVYILRQVVKRGKMGNIERKFGRRDGGGFFVSPDFLILK